MADYPRSGGFFNVLVSGCWAFGHSYVYVDGHGKLRCRYCGKIA